MRAAGQPPSWPEGENKRQRSSRPGRRRLAPGPQRPSIEIGQLSPTFHRELEVEKNYAKRSPSSMLGESKFLPSSGFSSAYSRWPLPLHIDAESSDVRPIHGGTKYLIGKGFVANDSNANDRSNSTTCPHCGRPVSTSNSHIRRPLPSAPLRTPVARAAQSRSRS